MKLTTANQQLVLSEIKKAQDLNKIVQDNQKNMLQTVESVFFINIERTFQDLQNVSSLLRLAHSAAGHHSCSVPIINIKATYQGVVNDTETASDFFLKSIVSVIKWHMLAIKAVKSDKIEGAKKYLNKSMDHANKMSAKSEELSNKFQHLVDLSKDALEQATNDKSLRNEEKEQIAKSIEDSKRRESELTKTIDRLQELEEKASEEEEKYEKRAEKQRERDHTVKITQAWTSALSGVILAAGQVAQTAVAFRSPTAQVSQASQVPAAAQSPKEQAVQTNEGNTASPDHEDKSQVDGDMMEENSYSVREEATSDATTLDGMVLQLNQEKWQLRKLLCERESEIAGHVHNIKACVEKKDDLQAAIASLETTVAAVAKVHTAFINSKKLWDKLGGGCKAIVDDIDLIKDEEDPDDLIYAIQESGSAWFELGIFSALVYHFSREVSAKINQSMNNLPVGQDARKQVVEELIGNLKTIEN